MKVMKRFSTAMESSPLTALLYDVQIFTCEVKIDLKGNNFIYTANIFTSIGSILYNYFVPVCCNILGLKVNSLFI